MQSWPGPGQNGSPDEHGQWPSNYFGDQNGQFDPGQPWPQSLSDQQGAYSQHISPQDASNPNFFNPQGDAFLPGSLDGTPTGQPGFSGHDALTLGQQYPQSAQNVIDPAFSNVNPELYAQQGKLGMADGISMSPAPNHPHTHPQNQAFEYSFAPNEPAYESPVQQYAQPHLIPQQSRQQSHTPVQQYDGMQNGFAQPQAYSRPQQSPVQHQAQHQQQPPPQRQFSQAQTYGHPANGQPNYHPNAQLSFQQQPQQQQQGYPQPGYGLQKPPAYSQPGHPSGQVLQQPQSISPVNQRSPSSAYPVPRPASTDPSHAGSAPPEPAPKKRKRVTKSAAEVAAVEHATPPVVDLTDDVASRTMDDVKGLVAPVPTAEEAQMINKFAKRSKTAQAKQPSIKGLPHLVYDGGLKLPAPKSYDKLSPLVALPPRTGRSMVPELGYNLPCELQGRFTSLYRPSADKIGLDERRNESKVLLDGYDESMKALGKRRPKYTEYPHAFKEQLKADEATKNKAGKKAKKELEEATKPIRPATRPADPVDAAVWDIIGFVHVEKSIEKTNALIASRVQQAGDFLVSLRTEAHRLKLELDQMTMDKVVGDEFKKVKEEMEQKREALYKALDAAIEHADDRVLDNLGGHHKLVLSLINTLIVSIKAGDFSGKLPKMVLELFTQVRMTKKIAEATNFDTVRRRLADKGDAEVKELVRDISARVKKAVKAAEAETATGYTGTSAASRAKTAPKPADASAKRGRDDDTDSRTVKKIAVESGGSALSKKLAQPKTATSKPATSILPGKTRPVAKSVPKSEPIKADSPAGSGDDKLKAEKPPKAETKPPAPKMGAAPSSSALSGIASLLDSINAPKAEVPVPAPRESKAPETPETPEQRAKRLHKEARRKLRVSWKPEGELVQVQIFHKDDEEDEGREVNMIRDAADDRSEGMVLKQRANVDEDDDEDDIPYQPWSAPSATDFSNLADEVRNKNYSTRGGNVKFTTDEQQRITEREQRELMAIYTDPDDIPPTPRSPPPDTSAAVEAKVGHLPENETRYREIECRWRDTRLMGSDAALYAALKRFEQQQGSSGKLDTILGRLNRGSQSQHRAGNAGARFTNVPLATGSAAEELLLAWLASDKVQRFWSPEPNRLDLGTKYAYANPEAQMMGFAIEGAVKELDGKPYPATSPPAWLAHDEEKVREWWFGYNKEVASKQRKAEEEHARREAPANAQDWGAYYAQQQYMALMQQMTGAGQPTAAAGPSNQQSQIPDNQLQSMLAAINQPGQAPQQPPAAGALNPNDPSYQQYLMLAQMQGQASGSGAHDAERDWERDWDRGEQGKDRDYKDGRKKKATLPPHKPANKALIGTKPCTFWQQGKCARGDKCTFRHD